MLHVMPCCRPDPEGLVVTDAEKLAIAQEQVRRFRENTKLMGDLLTAARKTRV